VKRLFESHTRWLAAAVLVLPMLLACGDPQPATTELTDAEVIERYTAIFGKSKQTLWPNRWLGVNTVQNPNDVWITQEILTEIKPDFLIEAGTFRGGSSTTWAMVLSQLNPDARVITIDIEDQVTAAKDLPIVKEKVDFMIGSSTDPKIVAEVARRTQGKKVVVLLDSAHTKEHVLAELEAYAPMVQKGSYIVVQDTGGVLIQDPDPGPAQAVRAFLAKDDRFEIDLSRERMLLTLHPNGYLKRVR
jgi:cephalosporin hydroxylase